ncbi:hypothetical protein HK098_003176 [Nowakowskiella sp. JEL0407]|nr:hypothetical protein HK098_003176 [Nowakowskiella sp. JEL0407]
MSNVRKTKSQQTINTDHNRQPKNKKFASTANIYSASPFPISIQANIIVNENSSLSKSSIRGRKHLGESERKKIVRWSSVPTVLNAEKTVSVAKDRKNDAEELKIFKNFDVNADDVAVELRLEKELPKYGYLANLLKRNGTLFLRSNLEESFSKFLENDEKKVGINTCLSHFFKECAKSTKKYLESCKFSSQNDAISAPQNSNESEKLKNSFLTWWKMNCAYLNFQRQREIDIEKMLEEFKNLEEQNIILKDVLTHVQKQNGSRYSFKINVVKEEFEFGKRNKEMCDKEVSTTNLDCDDDSGSQPQNVVEVPSSHEIYPRDQEINFPNSTPTIFSTDSSLDSIRAEEPATEILQDKDYNSEVNFSEQQADSNDQSLNTVENRTLDSVDRSRGGLDINETSQSVSASVNIEPKLNDDDNAGTEKVQNIAQASNFLQVRNIETDEKLCGEDTPIPIFHSVGVEADFPHPSEAELELCKSKLEQRELELLKLQQATQLLKSEHLIEINNLKQPYESEIEKIKHKFDTLQNQNKDLETTCVELNAEASRWERKAIEAERREAIGNEKIAKWEKEIEVKKKELQSVQEECAKLKENFSMLTDSNLALKTSFESTCTQLSETNQTLETTAEELNDIRLSLESAKFELEKSKKSETEAKTKCGEYHHTVLKRNEELQEMHVKLKGLESSERVHSIKVKELETIINNLMKFPDMSLGDDFTPTGQISLSQFDAMLSEMISSNNLRISLLEQKNNELRMQRIKLGKSCS